VCPGIICVIVVLGVKMYIFGIIFGCFMICCFRFFVVATVVLVIVVGLSVGFVFVIVVSFGLDVSGAVGSGLYIV